MKKNESKNSRYYWFIHVWKFNSMMTYREFFYGVIRWFPVKIFTMCDNWAKIHKIFFVLREIILRMSIRPSEAEKKWKNKHTSLNQNFDVLIKTNVYSKFYLVQIVNNMSGAPKGSSKTWRRAKKPLHTPPHVFFSHL